MIRHRHMQRPAVGSLSARLNESEAFARPAPLTADAARFARRAY
mgnify:CR=1 FL=1